MSMKNQAEHWAIVGKTGSGKSIFAQFLLMLYAARGYQIISVDIERKIEPASARTAASLVHPREWKGKGDLPDDPFLVYFPTVLPAWKDAQLELLYQQALAEGNCVVFHDEIVGLADQARSPQGLLRLYSQGRKRRAIGIICTQRPICIPRIVLTQATNIAAFKLSDPQDLAIAAQRMYQPQMKEKGWPEPHGYWLLMEQQMDRAEWRPALTRADIEKAAAQLRQFLEWKEAS